MRKLVKVIVVGAAGAMACQPGQRESREQDGTAQQEQPGRAGMPEDEEQQQLGQAEQQEQTGQQPTGQQPGQGQEMGGGEMVTVQGQVSDTYGDQVFKVSLEQGGEVIVVTPRPMQGVQGGSQVAVSGEMQQGGVAQIERDLGVNLSPDAEREIEQGNVIVARSMQLQPEQQQPGQPQQPGQQQQMPQ